MRREAKKCSKDGDKLPETCSKGLQFSPAVSSLVDKCLGMYQSDPNVLKLAKC